MHDGDGFRLFHDAEVGFMSLFSSHSPSYKRGKGGARLTYFDLHVGMDLKSNTLNIRIAGIDAPEVRPTMHIWLTSSTNYFLDCQKRESRAAVFRGS